MSPLNTMFKKLDKPKRLMLVDDSVFDLKINKLIATHTKLFEDIQTFISPGEALDYLASNVTDPNKLPQLILLDIQMPEMTGFEFMEKYAKLPQSLKDNCHVAMLSSTDDLTDINKAKANINIVKLLRKPLDPATIKQFVDDYYN